MKNHLQSVHNIKYLEYLKKVSESNKSKAEEKRKAKELEEEVEESQSVLAEVSGIPESVRRRPVTQPITRYFHAGKGPVKYSADSDFQRRFELETAIYFVTANKPFAEIESQPFRR